MKAFISYSRDATTVVRRLHNYLTAHGIDTWIKEKDLLPGTSVSLAIERAIDECDAYIFVMSQETSRSEWASRELSLVRARYSEQRKPILPILVDRAADPPFFLREIAWLNFTDDSQFEMNAARLVDALRAGQPPTPKGANLERLQQLLAEREMLSNEAKQLLDKKVHFIRFTVIASVAAGLLTVLAAALFLANPSSSMWASNPSTSMWALSTTMIGYLAGVASSLIVWRLTRGKQ